MRPLSTVMILCLCANGFCAGPDDELQVDVLGGHDAIVSTAVGAPDIRIRVVDRNSKPVEGASVSAVLPGMGAGGHFRGGGTIATKVTDSDGTVQFSGIHLRKVAGDFTTRILARKGFRAGSAQLTQTASNTAADEPKKGLFSTRNKIIMGVAAAGVAAGIAAAVCCGGEAPAAPSFTVTPGAPTTTGPR
jgi:hypothetical protein